MFRKLLIGVVVGVLATGIFFAVAKADMSTTDGINVDYKAELLSAADDLIDSALGLLDTARDSLFEPLLIVKDCKVGYEAALENLIKYTDSTEDLQSAITTILTGIGLTGDDVTAYCQTGGLLGIAQIEEAAFDKFSDVHSALRDVEETVQALIQNIEQGILDGVIGQTTAVSLIKKTIVGEDGLEHPYAPLLVIMVFLSDKDIYLVEMDKLIEQALEYESETMAVLEAAINTCDADQDATDTDIHSCQVKAIKQAITSLKSSIKIIKQAEAYIWLIKDNIKDIKAWLCGFKQLVIRAPLLVPEEETPAPICPWCLPPASAASATELRTYSSNGTIRFAALGGAVQGMRVQIFSLAGRSVFDSGLVASNALAWRTYGVANGVYLYIIEVKTAAGLTRSEVHKLAVVN